MASQRAHWWCVKRYSSGTGPRSRKVAGPSVVAVADSWLATGTFGRTQVSSSRRDYQLN